MAEIITLMAKDTKLHGIEEVGEEAHDRDAPAMEASQLPTGGEMRQMIWDATQEMRRDMWEWDIAIRFLQGDQYLRYNSSLAEFVFGRQQPGRNRVVVNHILPIFRTQLSNLTMNYPAVAMAPMSDSYDHLAMALADEEMFRYWWEAEDFMTVLRTMMLWLVSCGTAGVYTYYDPDKDKVCSRAVSPYDLRFEPGCADLSESTFRAVRSLITRRDLARMYPDFEEYIETLQAVDPVTNARDRPPTQSYLHRVPKDRVELWDVHFNDGRYGVFAGDRWLFETRMPKGPNPVQVAVYQRTPGKLFGQGMIVPIVDLQRSFNRVFNMIIDMIETMSNPIWKVPIGAGVPDGDLDNAPGRKVRFNPAGGEPRREPGVPVPPHMFEELRQIQSMMMDVANIHANSLGKRQPGVNSGVAIQQITEQDSAGLATTQQSIEQLVKHTAETMLVLTKNYSNESKMVRMFDGRGQIIWRELNATRLSDEPQVCIEANSSFQSTIDSREKKLWSLVQLGAMDPKEALKRSNLRNFDQDRMRTMADYAHARDILEAAKQGLPVEVFSTDNTEAIGNTFKQYMESPMYYQPYEDAVRSGNPEAINETKRKMDNIRNLYMSIVAPPEATAEEVMQLADKKVYPRPSGPPMPPGNPNPQIGPKPDNVNQMMSEQAKSAEGSPAPMNPTGMGGG